MKHNSNHKSSTCGIGVAVGLLAALGVSANAQVLEHYYGTETGDFTVDQVGTANGTLYGSSVLGGSGELVTITEAAGLNAGAYTGGVGFTPGSVTAGITGDFSFSVWYQITDGGADKTLVAFSDGTSATMVQGVASSYTAYTPLPAPYPYATKVYGQQAGGGFTDVIQTLDLGSGYTWTDDGGLHNMVFSYDSSTTTGQLYVDGVAMQSGVYNALDLSSMTYVGVQGASPWGSGEQSNGGSTYAFGVWSSTLGPYAVSQLYSLGENATAAQVALIPEPSTFALLGLGLAALVTFKRKRA